MTISELPVVRIIDDNDVMRESLVFLLEEEDGWIVKAYRDAEEFLDNDDLSKPDASFLISACQNVGSGTSTVSNKHFYRYPHRLPFGTRGCRHGHSCSEARGFRPVAKTC